MSAVPGFFRALVDFRFTTFITRRIAGFIYAILLVSILLAGLVAFFSIVVTGVGLMTGGQPVSGVLTVLGALVLVPIALVVVLFAVANRAPVRVSFDPSVTYARLVFDEVGLNPNLETHFARQAEATKMLAIEPDVSTYVPKTRPQGRVAAKGVVRR